MSLIYRALFPNGKSYIGQTNQLLGKRMHQHKIKSKDGKEVFHKAIRKYGFDAISWSVIEEVETQEELNEKEIYWIDFFRTYVGFSDCNGYNSTLRGGGTEKFTKWNDKQLKEIGEAIKNCVPREEIKKKYNLFGKMYFEIARGERWSRYTGIKYDPTFEKNSILTKYQVDYIIKRFIEIGDITQISKEIKIRRPIIRKMLKGETWSDYTKIKDSSFFYNNTKTTKYTQEQIDYIINNPDKDCKQIGVELGIPHYTVVGIRNGRILSNITGIQHIKKEDREIPVGADITKEQAQLIVNLYDEGLKISEIATKLKISRGIVSNIVNGKTWTNQLNVQFLTKEQKVKRGDLTNKVSFEDIDRIIALHKERVSNKQIFEKINHKISKSQISAIVCGKSWAWYTKIAYIPKRK